MGACGERTLRSAISSISKDSAGNVGVPVLGSGVAVEMRKVEGRVRTQIGISEVSGQPLGADQGTRRGGSHARARIATRMRNQPVGTPAFGIGPPPSGISFHRGPALLVGLEHHVVGIVEKTDKPALPGQPGPEPRAGAARQRPGARGSPGAGCGQGGLPRQRMSPRSRGACRITWGITTSSHFDTPTRPRGHGRGVTSLGSRSGWRHPRVPAVPLGTLARSAS